MITELLRDVILQNIGPLKPAPKEWFKQNCRMCHLMGHGQDKRNRFGIQFTGNSIVCHCFNCGYSASFKEGGNLGNSFKKFLKTLNISDKFIKQVEFEIFKNKNNISDFRDGHQAKSIDKIKELVELWKPMDLPDGSLPIMTWLENGVDDPNLLQVAEYAIGRGFTKLDDLYWSPYTFKNLNNRLLIPYHYNGKIVGFTSRLTITPPEGVYIPKYYQQSPTDFVFNLDEQVNTRKIVIVNEGVFDAYITGGVGILGEMNQTKADIINRLGKRVIVSPDRDKKGWDLVNYAIENNWEVSFPKWQRGIKDASQAAEKYGKLLTVHSIIAGATEGKDRITVKWKLMQK